MQSPAVMFIESAIDELKDVPEFIADSQKRELVSLGPARAQKAGASGLTPDFIAGYVLGLQTGRVMNSTSPMLALKGIKAEDIF